MKFNDFSSNLSTFAPGVSMVEIESLKGQIKEWKEKYETIRIKRQVFDCVFSNKIFFKFNDTILFAMMLN